MLIIPSQNIHRNLNWPLVSVILINSREETHPTMVKAAKISIKLQTYPNIELVEVRNLDRKTSIGKCWNSAIKAAKGDYVLFMGDDDRIVPELITFLYDYYSRAAKRFGPNIIGSSCWMYRYEDDERIGLMNSVFTGFYEKEKIKNLPFDESLKNGVDTQWMKNFERLGYILATCEYFQGYW